MGDGPEPTRQRVLYGRVEFRLLPIFGPERTLVRPPHSEVQGKVLGGPKVILEEEGVGPPARQPGGAVLRELRALDGPQQETGERVPRVRPERVGGGVGEVVNAGGAVLLEAVIP